MTTIQTRANNQKHTTERETKAKPWTPVHQQSVRV